MDSTCEVVITGAGVVSPIGIGKEAFWESLRAGRSGIRTIDWLKDTPYPAPMGGEIVDFDAKQYVQPRKSLKVMCREIQTGFSAAVLALQDAALPAGHVDPDRYGVVFGSEMFYCEAHELEASVRSCVPDGQFHHEDWGTRGLSQLYPLWMLKYLPNMVACHIGIAQDARGPNNTITLGEASSLLAILEAARVIGRGHADVMIVGSTGSRLSLTPMMFRGHANLSHSCEEPRRASRPFDAKRNGMVNGEGAAAFIVESHQHAKARGATVIARILGSGSSFESRLDGRAPEGRGIRNAIQMALKAAQTDASQIDHVNAHGVSTIEDDRIEASAIRACLGDVPVTALKSYFGNLGTGGGAVEAIASVVSFAKREIPFTLNYENPDPQCPVRVVAHEPLAATKDMALLLNHSGTGQAAAVILGAP